MLGVNILIGASVITQILVVLGALLIGALILGPFMKKLFNSPEMHIWHHAYDLPSEKKFGVNFGLTLAIWDYVFKTAYLPHNGKDIRLGFPGIEQFPENFLEQNKFKH